MNTKKNLILIELNPSRSVVIICIVAVIDKKHTISGLLFLNFHLHPLPHVALLFTVTSVVYLNLFVVRLEQRQTGEAVEAVEALAAVEIMKWPEGGYSIVWIVKFLNWISCFTNCSAVVG